MWVALCLLGIFLVFFNSMFIFSKVNSLFRKWMCNVGGTVSWVYYLYFF